MKAKKVKTEETGKPIPVRNARGQLLIALRTMTINGKRYPCGAVLDANALPAKQMAAMINSRAARWEQKTSRKYPQPTDLPKAEPVKAQPVVVQIVDDVSAFESWKLTKAALTRVLDGNEALAMDVLMSSPEARDLYKRAQTEATRAEAKRRKTVSVCPSEIAGL
jgi:hypothetical protein